MQLCTVPLLLPLTYSYTAASVGCSVQQLQHRRFAQVLQRPVYINRVTVSSYSFIVLSGK